MTASPRKLVAQEWTRDLLLVILAAIWMGCSSSPSNSMTDGGGGLGGHAGAAGGMGGHAGAAGGMSGQAGAAAGGAAGAAGGAGTTGLGGSAGASGAKDGGVADANGGAGGGSGATGGGAGAGQAGAGGGGGASGAAGSGAAGNAGHSDGAVVDGCVSGDLAGTGVPAGTIATASAFSAADATADKAIDGDTTTRWNAGDHTGWITLTFPAPVAISGLRLHVHASPETTESYTVTSSSSTTAIGSATADVTLQPGLVLPDIFVPPGSYSDITITVNGGASWVAIDAIWLLPFACH